MEKMYTLTTPDGVTYEIADKYARELLENISAGASFTTDATLTLNPQTGVLSVNTASAVQAGNALPVTSAAVYAIVGDIESILNQI